MKYILSSKEQRSLIEQILYSVVASALVANYEERLIVEIVNSPIPIYPGSGNEAFLRQEFRCLGYRITGTPDGSIVLRRTHYEAGDAFIFDCLESTEVEMEETPEDRQAKVSRLISEIIEEIFAFEPKTNVDIFRYYRKVMQKNQTGKSGRHPYVANPSSKMKRLLLEIAEKLPPEEALLAGRKLVEAAVSYQVRNTKMLAPGQSQLNLLDRRDQLIATYLPK